MLDIFNNNAFGIVALTDFINDVKYRPNRIGTMGLFNPVPVATTSIALESIGDIIQLVKPSPRGGVGETKVDPKRKMMNIPIPHFERPWSVNADEVQGVRAFGSEDQVQTIQDLVGSRIAGHSADFDMTEEQARLGAVTGIVTYADGTSLDLYSTFGVTQEVEVDFDLDNATPADGILRKRCTQVVRTMKKRLGNVAFTQVHAFVGDSFFDDLLQHKEVRDTYKGWNEAQILRDSYVGKNRSENPTFEFGGIVFENYGAVDGEGVGIAADKARFFPVGVQNLFKTYYGPADYNSTVNTMGRRLYAMQRPMENDKGITGEVQMNALQLCTRPGALMGARRT